MGLDVVGWRDCSLQRELQFETFMQRLKLRAYKKSVEDNFPAEARQAAKVHVSINDEQQALSYAEICEQLNSFERGIPECTDCPLSGGAPVGCYRYVSYPIDAAFEEMIFSYFYDTLPINESPAQYLLDESVQVEMRYSDTPYHARGQGALAERDEPLSATFATTGDDLVIDSAHLLTCLFALADENPSVSTLSEFFDGFFRWIEQHLTTKPIAAKLGEAEEVEVTVPLGEEPTAPQLTAKLALPLAERGRTLSEVRKLADLLRVIASNDDYTLHAHG